MADQKAGWEATRKQNEQMMEMMAYLLGISRRIHFLGILRRQWFLGIFRQPKFVGIFRYLFSLGMFPRTVPSEISEEIPTNSPRKYFFGISSESLVLGIPSEFSEEILLSDEKFPTTNVVGMSSEYRYSEDIPTLFVVGMPVSVYSIWLERNEKRHKQQLRAIAQLALLVDKVIRIRIMSTNYQPKPKLHGLRQRWFSTHS
uniref:Uncharacterized protein n=1 Tax=Brassica oleracea var. oleracea TaxID=109376 RepID=A0A0D2ZQK5_BRAOL